MAILTSKLILTSTDLTTDSLALSHQTTFTASHTSGLARENIKSISKIVKIACLDGDAVTTGAALEGQYIDITDNHGLKKRYVVTDTAASGVATGTLIVANTDIGSTSTPPSNLYGAVSVGIGAGSSQNLLLAQLKIAIADAQGHNGSITVGALASAANGPQSITLTNSVSGESGMFTVDSTNSTLSILDKTGDADATNSKEQHSVIIAKGKYASPAIYYIKNTATYNASTNIVYLYWDDAASTEFIEMRGGQFAYFPGNPQHDLMAYTSTANTIVEFMAVGTEA
jgi:hypothetical protein